MIIQLDRDNRLRITMTKDLANQMTHSVIDTADRYLSIYTDAGTVYEDKTFYGAGIIMTSKKYFTDGTIEEQCSYTDGVLVEKATYRQNGTCAQLISIHGGNRVNTSYDALGELSSVHSYTNGVLTGPSIGACNVVQDYKNGVKINACRNTEIAIN